MPVFCWPETPYSPLLAQIFQATKVQEGRGRKRGREDEATGGREEGGRGDLEVGGSGERERLAKRRREESEEAVEVAALGDVTDWELTVLDREGEEGMQVGEERGAKKIRGRQYSPTVFYPGTTVCLAEELEPLYR